MQFLKHEENESRDSQHGAGLLRLPPQRQVKEACGGATHDQSARHTRVCWLCESSVLYNKGRTHARAAQRQARCHAAA
jgi:hypothetical protein